MLEQYFVKPQTLDRIRHSWLGTPIESYVIWLTERGYAARIIHRRVPILMHFAEFARARGASTFDKLPALVDGFVEHRVRTHRRRGRTKQAKPWVASAARVPVEQMLDLLIPEFSPRHRTPPPTPFCRVRPRILRLPARRTRTQGGVDSALWTQPASLPGLSRTDRPA